MVSKLSKANNELNQDLMGDDLFDTEEIRVRRCPRCQSENIHASRKQSTFERFMTTLGGEVLRCHVCFRRSAWFGMNYMRVSNGKQEGPFRPRRLNAPTGGAVPSKIVVSKPVMSKSIASKPVVSKPLNAQTAPVPAAIDDVQSTIQALVQTKVQSPVSAPVKTNLQSKLEKFHGSASTRSALQRLQDASSAHLHTAKPGVKLGVKLGVKPSVLGTQVNFAVQGTTPVSTATPTTAATIAKKPNFFSVPTTKLANQPAFAVTVAPKAALEPVVEAPATIAVSTLPTITQPCITLPNTAGPDGTPRTIHLPKRLVERRKIGFRIGELPKWPGQLPTQSGSTHASGQLARQPR